MYRILVVEDDAVIAAELQAFLERWDYTVRCVEDFHAVDRTFLEFDPQLVLLDILLPAYNGYHWCKRLRELSHVPIVFLSSASDNMNIVMAVNMGGDDFVAKPFDPQVLLAKVQAMLRRAYSFGEHLQTLEHRGAVLHLGDATLMVNGERIDLTKNEFKMLQQLLERKGQTVSRSELMKRLWESDSFIDDNTLTVNMARLRKKLDEAGLENFIRTKKGLGYLIGEEL